MHEIYFSSLNKKKKKPSKISRTNVISVVVVAGIAVLVGGIALNSFIPVNSDGLVFAPTSNIFLKAVKSAHGSHYYQHAKGGKVLQSSEGPSPPISASLENLIQIHLINEEKNELGSPSRHNLNIDEFNVHIKDLSYFQSGTVTFLADKEGSFDYYCSIHPEMRGIITVTR